MIVQVTTGGSVAGGQWRVYLKARIGRTVSSAGSPFAGTECMTIGCKEPAVNFDVYASTPKAVTRHWDEVTGCAVYLIGKAQHPTLTGPELLEWIARTGDVSSAAYCNIAGLKELLGYYCVLIDDRRRGRISIISDPLGVRPFFIGQYRNQLVGGTEVLGICDAGLTAGRVNFEALSSWLCYNVAAGGASVVEDYCRVPQGAVTTYEPTGRELSRTRFAQVEYRHEQLSDEALSDGLFERQSHSSDRLVDGCREINVPLSGGHDSRLLCALAARRPGLVVQATTVESTPEEASVAKEVAKVLRVPHRVLRSSQSTMDLIDEPLWFRPEGLPGFRNLTNAIARQRPGVPVVNGFIGDLFMRGKLDENGRAFYRQDFAALPDETLARLARGRFHVASHRLDLLRDGVGERIVRRAVRSLIPMIRHGRESGRALRHTNMVLRNVHHISGIFLSHEGVAESRLPFYAWNLIDFSTAHIDCLNSKTQQRMFERHVPALAGIPHETDIRTKPPCFNRPTRHLKGWARELLRQVPSKWETSAVALDKLLRRAPRAAFLGRGYQNELQFLYRIHRPEARLRQANIELNWAKL